MRPRTESWVGAMALLALSGTAAGTGCGGSFDPYNRLNSLRVLAIRSEPVAPAMGETSTIDAKLYTLPGQDATYAWSWCPFATAPGAACPITEGDVSAMTGVQVSFTLPAAADGSTTFTNPFPLQVFQTLCAGMGNIAAPNCTDGYPIQLQLTVTTDNDQVQAVRPMRLRFRDTDQANTNPTVVGLFATLSDGSAPQQFDGDPPPTMPTLPRHVKTAINTVIPDGTSELYNGTDDHGMAAQVYERLNLSWFIESGDTDSQRTGYIAGAPMLKDPTKVNWTPAFKKDYAPDTSRLILIIRDDRQGEGWIDGIVSLEPAP